MFSYIGGATSLLLLPLLALAPATNSASSASSELPPVQYQNSASLFSPWDGCTTYTPSSLASPGFTGGMEQCDGTTSPGLDGVTDFASTPATVSLPLMLGAGQWEQLRVQGVSATPLTSAQWQKLAPEGAIAPSTTGKVTALKPEVTASLSDPSAVVKKDMTTDERVNVQFAAPSFKEETGDRLNQVGWLARVDVHVTATAESGKQYQLTLSELTSIQGQSWYDLPKWKQTATDEGVECAEGELCAGGVVYALTTTSYAVEDANEYAAEPSEPEPSTEPTAPATSKPASPAPSAEPTKPTEPSKQPTAPTPAPPLVSGPVAPTAPVAPEKPAEPVVKPSAPATPSTPVSSPTEPAVAVPSTPATPAASTTKGTGTPELEARSSEPVAASGSSANSSPSSPSGTAAAEPKKQVKAVGSPDSLQLSAPQQVQLALLLLVLLYAAAMTIATARRILAVEEAKKKRLKKRLTLTREQAMQIQNRGEES